MTETDPVSETLSFEETQRRWALSKPKVISVVTCYSSKCLDFYKEYGILSCKAV
jgi:hypothetical protein